MRDRGVNVRLAQCLNSVLDVKALVGAFNQEKALVGAFSVITNLRMELFEALVTRVVWSDLLPVCLAVLAQLPEVSPQHQRRLDQAPQREHGAVLPSQHFILVS